MRGLRKLIWGVALSLGVATVALAGRGKAPNHATRGAGGGVAAAVVRDGEYTSRDDVAAYIRKFQGELPKNYITKREARELGWPGGPLEPYAPGKSIGGDRFGNYERRLPDSKDGYKECDIDTKGRARGAKRLVFTPKGKRIYYTEDHYNSFTEVK